VSTDAAQPSWRASYERLLRAYLRLPSDELLKRIEELGGAQGRAALDLHQLATGHMSVIARLTTENDRPASEIIDSAGPALERLLAAYDAARDGKPTEHGEGPATGTIDKTACDCSRPQDHAAILDGPGPQQNLPDGVPVGLYRTTAVGEFLEVNEALLRIFGYPDRETLMSRNVADLYADPQERASRLEQLEQAGVARGAEIRARRYDGTRIWVNDNSRTVCDSRGRVLYYEGSVEDITERKLAEEALLSREQELQRHRDLLEHLVIARTEELARLNQRLHEKLQEQRRTERALRESEERFRQLAESIHEVFWLIDPSEAEVLYVSPAFEQLWGRSTATLNRGGVEAWLQGMHEEDRKVVMRDIERQRHGDTTENEFRITCPDGSTRWIRGRAFPIRDAKGEVYRVAGVCEDITERKQAQDALRASEARYRMLAEHATDIISRHDPEGRYVYASQAITKVLGYQPAEVLGEAGYKLVHPDDLELVRRFHERIMIHEGVNTVTMRAYRKDGTCVWLECRGQAVRDPGSGEVLEIIAVTRDVTARREAEEAARRHREELAHVARVSIMGEMASGLAHELAQPLSAILYYARSCASQLAAGTWSSAQATEAMQKIAAQAEKAGEFTRRLKAFVRKAQPRRVPSDLNPIVRDALAIAAPEARQNQVAVSFELQPGLPLVVVDRVQVEQVVLNLMRNSIEAMAAIPTDRRRVQVRSFSGPGNTVCVSVQDTGSGLPDGAAEHAFDPFFTTKPAGTGLGLSISRSIIEAHEGEMWLEAAPEGGTVSGFRLAPAQGRSE
jgi:two-component system sensor kinase FixL